MNAPVSIRIRFAAPSPDARGAIAAVSQMAQPNESVRAAFATGLQKLVYRAQRERFSGKGPFPVSERRLGNVSGRLKRSMYENAGKNASEGAAITTDGYRGSIMVPVEYFAAHEVGFQGKVNVPAHTRGAYTVKRKKQTRTSKTGKQFSVRANKFSVLPGSVRAHTKNMNIPARRPLRTAIEQHAGDILGAEIERGILKAASKRK